MKIEISKPRISATVGTNFFGILKKALISCVAMIMLGIAITASQKFV